MRRFLRIGVGHKAMRLGVITFAFVTAAAVLALVNTLTLLWSA